jgi:hypothetical protein
MPSARDIKAGSAYVVIGAIDQTAAVLKRVAARFKAIGAAITSIGIKTLAAGGTLTAPFIAATKIFADMGDEINKASQRTGIAVEELSALKYAADQSGSSLGDLEVSLKKMSVLITNAREGQKQAIETLSKLGLTFDDLKDRTPDVQFKVIADNLAKVSDATTKASLAIDVFGKSGTQLLPLLADGEKGLQALEDRARDLGLTFSQEDADAATKFGDILSDLWKQFKQVNFVVGEAIAKFLQPYAEAATRTMKTIIDWTKQNQAFILTVAAVGVGLLAAGAAIVALGATLSGIGTILGAVATGLTAISAVLGAMISPIGLVVAGLVGLGVVFATTSETGQKAMSFLADTFYQLRDIAKTAFGGIADALAAGKIQLAAKILWAALKLEWLAGTEALQKTWIKFKTQFVEVAIAAFYGAIETWTNVSATLETLWKQSATAFQSIWHKAIDATSTLFEDFAKMEQKTQVDRDVKSGKISAGEGDKRKQFIDQQFSAQQNLQTQKNATAEAEAQKKLADDIAGIETARAAKVEQIRKDELALTAAAEQNSDGDQKKLTDEITRLKAELAALTEQAHNERPGPSIDVKKVQDATEGVARRFSSAGTFGAGAVAGLLGTDTADHIAENTRRTADGIDRLIRKFPVSVVS